MPTSDETLKRGRPQTLNRDLVLNTALMSYWAEGPTRVSISHVCHAAEVSKPGLYREFGNDDGLKDAVLDLYREMVLVPFYDILDSDASFEQQIEDLIGFTIQDRQALGIPCGCLHVAMRAHRDDLGEISRNKVDLLRRETLQNYERWIARAKSRGEFKSDMSSKVAALYCDAQNGGAMRMQREGVPNDVIGQALRLAFSSLN
jgi:AcrR family transcriptional regulator